ncbi:MAG TPA: Rsd/AlgQ family anti-sigma factor [Gammaproteobacteria bacterium]|nr:Rsd/AlgQ family anti-sigma factor [Gammaproteobacteria bacterium]
MLQESRPADDRRVRSVAIVNKLLGSRTEVLTLYNRLVGQRPYAKPGVVAPLLQQFCQALVDYTAHAHFQIYRHFSEKRERRQAVLKVANDIYPQILGITQTILDFNDQYDCEDHCDSLGNLDRDLSLLGEKLADLIELEDRLIAVFVGRGA